MCPVPQGRMSVAAVTSGRPSTPLQVSWFEFLLDGSLLENHLQKSYPGQISVMYKAFTRLVLVSSSNKPNYKTQTLVLFVK